MGGGRVFAGVGGVGKSGSPYHVLAGCYFMFETIEGQRY